MNSNHLACFAGWGQILSGIHQIRMDSGQILAGFQKDSGQIRMGSGQALAGFQKDFGPDPNGFRPDSGAIISISIGPLSSKC